ncbi:acetyl-CoA carboxylase, carboxyltransferase subunit beta [Acetobacter oeni]|uniref:Acetyl-coenzyme A carboxylase carboxyl transferase subunit beta n=1 Tax=Acetobacter oeni TaxID=304077 RepID=A0A511XLQ3_9PROT|nr:acetyl-CoA carboxylase, carboxyltransferase subunit beta [Acetobacter oeni]MBB3884299.1 acetyl-CoA carboxylase carboxyl transferase subunit beta [Acetobacter oeni]NHO20253.1 acetyl-CoA carboxylase carboxyltransferase subunit beta [Acetobacter oeni]GBR07667.1 acetyl-CoA carboxylase carboxyl transferase beta subunit [Acetobacter oeni LMG 21952]GEN63854.1 acetyl-coenzyme A carboxylase carboxyl transferase subunit beta [Acetobacter oeni]
MSWLTEYVRPKVRGLLRREVPDNLWTNCPSCHQMVLVKELERTLNVCPHCGFHMKVPVAERLKWTFDADSYTRIDLPKVAADPLGFRDHKRYADRLKDARAKTQLDDSIAVAHGKIMGYPAVVAVMAYEFMSGTMGTGFGEGFIAAARLAILQRAPLIVFTASGGARMQEGVMSLMQMPRTTVAIEMLKEAGLPYIVVLTDPTTGGVSASFAMLGDVQIAEPKALIGFAGPRVIEDTVREKLPEGFQRSEYLLEHGMLDMVVERKNLRATLGRLVGLLTAAPPGDVFTSTLPDPEEPGSETPLPTT